MAWKLDSRQRWTIRTAMGVAALFIINRVSGMRMPTEWEACSGWLSLFLMVVIF